MFELVINRAVVCTGTEQEVRAAGADKIRAVADFYDYAPQRDWITYCAERFGLGHLRAFSNSVAGLHIEIRKVSMEDTYRTALARLTKAARRASFTVLTPDTRAQLEIALAAAQSVLDSTATS